MYIARKTKNAEWQSLLGFVFYLVMSERRWHDVEIYEKNLFICLNKSVSKKWYRNLVYNFENTFFAEGLK